MQILDYLHFKIINSFLFDNKKQRPNYRAIFVISMCIFFNIIALGRAVFLLKGNYIIGLGIWSTIFFLLIRFFYSTNRYRRMLRRVNKNSMGARILWDVLIIGYIILSVLMLLLVLNKL